MSDVTELYSGYRQPVIPIHTHDPLVLCNATALRPICLWYPFCGAWISDISVVVGTHWPSSSVASAKAEQSAISQKIANLPVYLASHMLGILMLSPSVCLT